MIMSLIWRIVTQYLNSCKDIHQFDKIKYIHYAKRLKLGSSNSNEAVLGLKSLRHRYSTLVRLATNNIYK